MPPKKQTEKKKDKVVVDKTFGMKNKKGARGQEKVALFKQQQSQQTADAKKKKQEQQKELKKKTEAEKADELSQLFKSVQIVQKVPPGVDPKSILCVNFKNGNCEKGTRCKFSHDPAIERKTQKRDIYTDERTQKASDDIDSATTMSGWDEDQLKKVIEQKYKRGPTETDIVCKYFLEAIEKEKYGWFWQCPNGDSCHYKHALPQGYVLKKDKKKTGDSKKDVISLEEFLEMKRRNLSTNNTQLTPITKETFEKWKLDRKAKLEANQQQQQLQQNKKMSRSGRQLFELDYQNQMEFELDHDDMDQAMDLTAYRHLQSEVQVN